MSETTTDSERILTAQLHATPTPVFDGSVYDLRWDIVADAEIDEPHVAGLAILRPPKCGVYATFDFAEPERLVSISLPFGRVHVDETDDDDFWTQLALGGAISARDRTVARLLVGDAVWFELGRSQTHTFQLAPLDSWNALGTVAQMATELELAHQPLDGLLALEAAVRIGQVGGDDLSWWTADLIERARPALEMISPAWGDWADSRVQAELLNLLTRAKRLGMLEMGSSPAVAAWADQNEMDALGEAAKILGAESERAAAELDELLEDLRGETMLAGTRSVHAPDAGRDYRRTLSPNTDDLDWTSPTFRGGFRSLDSSSLSATADAGADLSAADQLGGVVATGDVTLMSDARDFGLESGTWQVVDDEITVSVRRTRSAGDPRAQENDLPDSIVARSCVRITSREGVLLAGSFLGPSAAGTEADFQSRLLLPRIADVGELQVVVGRELPFTAFTESDLDVAEALDEQRAAVRRARREHDASSRGSWRIEALAEFVRLSEVDGAEHDPDGPNGPVELWADQPDLDDRQLRGARSLEWTLRGPEAAARIEARRQRLAQRLDDLDIPALDRLACAAHRGGEFVAMRDLESTALRLVDEEL